MKNIVQLIRERKFTEAEDHIDNTVPLIMEKKIFEMKKAVAAKMCEQMKSASEKIRLELTEDEIEESIDPTEIHNGPAPTGQRVNSADKGDKQPPNTTVVPKNNLKEEELEENYHSSYTSAIQTAVKHAESRGYKVDPEDYDNKVATGPLRPREGKTVSHVLNLTTKDGKKSKKTLAVQIYNRGGKTPFELNHYISEDVDNLDEARINIVRARVRGGKVQRRKKVSNVPGMTFRGGTLKRMSAAERRRRKMGARKGKVKRRAKLSRSLMKRKRSLQKRKSLGL